ncbi:Conserved hypothetical protein [Yarrowia lipolytica]|nr:Conserved hypothetical protein [Yarrowia lipolytica]
MRCLLILLFLASVALASFYKNSPVVEAKGNLGPVLKSNKTSIVEFYAPWCGHCRNLLPEYVKASKGLRGLANVVAVDCDQEINKPVCAQWKVQGFPTLKIFRPFNDPKTGKKMRPMVEDYKGPREAATIVKEVSGRIKNLTKRLSSVADLKSLMESTEEDVHHILYLPATTKKLVQVPPVLKAIAIDFVDTAKVSFAPGKAVPDIVKHLQREYPSLSKLDTTKSQIVLLKKGYHPASSNKDMSHEGILKFVNQYVIIREGKNRNAPAKKTLKEFIVESDVPDLTTDNDSVDEEDEILTDAKDDIEVEIVEQVEEVTQEEAAAQPDTDTDDTEPEPLMADSPSDSDSDTDYDADTEEIEDEKPSKITPTPEQINLNGGPEHQKAQIQSIIDRYGGEEKHPRQASRIYSFAELRDACLKSDSPTCVIMSTSPYSFQTDLLTIHKAARHASDDTYKKVKFVYFVDITDELERLAEELGMGPYTYMKPPTDAKGGKHHLHEGSYVLLDIHKNKVYKMPSSIVKNDGNIVNFATKGYKKVDGKKLPPRYRFEYSDRDEL